MAAPAARLRRIGRIHLPQVTRLVGQLALQRTPATGQDAAVEPRLLLHVPAGFRHRALGRLGHALRVQILHHHGVRRVRQPQPTDPGQVQPVPVHPDGLGDRECRHGEVPGLEPGLALVHRVRLVPRVGVRQVLQAVAHHLVRVHLQPGMVRVVAQFREPPAQSEETRGRTGFHLPADGLGPRRLALPHFRPVESGHVHFLPARVPPLAVGQHVVPDVTAGAGDGRQQDAGGVVARKQTQADRAVDGLRGLRCRIGTVGHGSYRSVSGRESGASRTLAFMNAIMPQNSLSSQEYNSRLYPGSPTGRSMPNCRMSGSGWVTRRGESRAPGRAWIRTSANFGVRVQVQDR